MSTHIHFRKRQILEYQVETNLTYLAEQRNKLYPSSPSSFDSENISPVKDVTEPTDVYVRTELTPEKSTDYNNDAVQLTPYSENNEGFPINPAATTVGPTSPMKKETAAWVDIATKLMHSIESNLVQQKQADSSIDSEPSALLIAKLNILKGKSVLKSKQNKKPVSPNPKPKPPTQNLEAKRPNQIKNTVVLNHATSSYQSPYGEGKLDTQRIYDIIGVDPSWIKEKTEVVVKSEVPEEPTLPVEIKSEMVHELPHSSFKVPKSDQQLETKPKNNYSQEELEHIANRIRRIFGTATRHQQIMEEFAESGIHVYEQVNAESPQKIDDILIRSDFTSRTYKYTPAYSLPRTPKKPFVHVTADTVPEELLHLTAVADKLNGGREHNFPSPLRKYPYTSTDDERVFIIGPNGTQMSKFAWSEIDWSLAAPAVTRKVLMGVFDRNTLATHSLSGRPSPAFKDLNKPEKMPLDVNKVADILFIVTSRINVTQKEVRMAITSKCADECKILRTRKKDKFKAIYNKENTRVGPYYIPVHLPNDHYRF